MLKRLGLCAAALLFAIVSSATPAHAALVSFYTTGVFGSTGTSTVSAGAGASQVTLSFTGVGTAVSPVDIITPTQVTLGKILATGGDSTLVSFAGDSFTLTVWQSVPGAGSDQFVGAMTGTIRRAQSMTYITFSPLSFIIAGIRYTILEEDGGVAGKMLISPPSVGGETSIEAFVTPEPAATLLLGLGFLGSAAAARRRMRK